ncbi:MAG: radical SAM family heme chaperone HemW [Firmicutes bacterium]|nr:radical SAM family heme chaperone HemW [Bacillota bacterium]
MKSISIYLHIPFCVRKCSYCDFVSYSAKPFEENHGINRYFEAIKQELIRYKEKLSTYKVATIYLGGGTPSAVDGRLIHDLLNMIRASLNVTNDAEITIEVNPGTLTNDKLNHYKAAGINRVSMGLQTTNDQLLETIGRIHSTNDFITSYHALRDAGFNNISLDLMFGLPGQTLSDIDRAIKLIDQLKPQHVSAYSLKIEEGTPLFDAYEKGSVQLPSEELEREMYHRINSKLRELGIYQYELSNYALPGWESKHNTVYWENKPYLGVGVSSHSKLDDVRFSNTSNIHEYMDSIQKGESVIIDSEPIDAEEDLFESIILGLRLNKGIQIDLLNERYAIDFEARYEKVLSSLIQDHLIIREGNTIKLTELGRDLANQVFLRFML